MFLAGDGARCAFCCGGEVVLRSPGCLGGLAGSFCWCGFEFADVWFAVTSFDVLCIRGSVVRVFKL
jgi:hypothetical protein